MIIDIVLEGKKYSVKKVGFLGKVMGLMFSKKRNLLFELNNKNITVHGFFVFFPIHLYFLDENFNVVEKKILKPFRIYFPKCKAKWLVEISTEKF